jgi:hypothetical protein
VLTVGGILRRGFGFCAGLLGLGVVLALAVPASAEGRLEAHYTARLGGLPIAKGTWVVDISEARFTAAASGVTTGLIHLITNGEGTSAVHGTVAGGQPVATSYAATIKTSRKTDAVQMLVSNGNAKEVKLDPPPDPDPERVPVTEAQRQNILDPMTASLFRVPGTGSLLVPSACQRSLSVFDGRLRYDLTMAFKRMEDVHAEKGYSGPVVVCSVDFKPVGGFVPSRYAIRYLSDERDIEVWLAPIAGTRLLAPFRFQLPTPLGLGVVEATQFLTVGHSARAATKGTKTQ